MCLVFIKIFMIPKILIIEMPTVVPESSFLYKGDSLLVEISSADMFDAQF